MAFGRSGPDHRAVDDQPQREAPVAAAATPAPYRRVVRRLDHRVIAGVAAGLGDHFGVDPVLFRAGFVVLTVAGGVGVFAYLLAWWIIPPAGLPDRAPLLERATRWIRGGPPWFGVVLLGAGAAIVAMQLGLWHPVLFWGVGLIALGFVLYRGDAVRSAGPSRLDVPASPTIATAPPETATQSARWWSHGRRAAPSSPPRPRERSALGALVLGGLLLVVGGMAALDQANAISVRPVAYPAAALLVIGVGLVVGAWAGRARWLVVPGLLVVPAVLAASLIDVPLRGGYGRRTFHPVSATTVRSPYRLIAGDLILNLESLAAGVSRPVVATVGVGSILVVVPHHGAVRVRARTGAGELSVLDQDVDGIEARMDRRFGRGTTVIELDLGTGLGSITVIRAEPVAEDASGQENLP
jgi:phage shock protein PspC (stress-responsive transcriptional regulator)